jgi:glycosyltransferase involved in cell wall biosynthesis
VPALVAMSAAPPLIIATIGRREGNTGVHTHIRQLRQYLDRCGTPSSVVTPFSWGQALSLPVFGLRRALEPTIPAASVMWYRHWHELFLRAALRRRLAQADDCVIYAQCPLSAQAALRVRRGSHQRVVMAAHFRTSQADEWAGKNQIRHGGAVYRAIRKLERETIPRVDSIVYVSRWARDALVSWLPEAELVPSEVIGNFVTAPPAGSGGDLIGDLVTTGSLEPVKNHRFLLEVLAAANRGGRELTLDVFGEGPLRADLARQARSLGIDGHVRLRGFQSSVRDFLPRYRAYVHSSVSESSSLAIIEAMAAGLPVVAGDVGPISELCTDGVEARFWPLDDPVRAAVTLTALLDSEPDRQQAASAATARFRRDHNADVNGPRLRSFLLERPTSAIPRQ